MGADRLALAELELRDGLASGGDLRLLTGDRGEVLDGPIDDLAVTGGLADTGVDHDLHETGHLVHVREAEVLRQLGRDLGAVLLLKARLHFDSRHGSCGVSH